MPPAAGDARRPRATRAAARAALVIVLLGLALLLTTERAGAPESSAAPSGSGPRPILLAQLTSLPLTGASPAAEASTAIIGADRWQSAGYSGHGVRVAILDAGFSGYEAALGETLPEQVVARSFRADGRLAGGTDHGLHAAEIIHAIAPRAELYLLNFSSLDELGRAIDYLIEAEVGIVSFSLGYVHSGPGDGTGDVNAAVTRGASAGQLWTVAAGNWGEQQWSGRFVDANGDSRHEFAPGVDRVRHAFQAGDLITVSLRWDDEWGGTCSDYDLELFAPNGSLVRAARTIQDCEGDPVEALQVLATRTGPYSVRITAAATELPHDISLLFVGSPDRGTPIDIPVATGSLAEPADHPLVLTVGALATSPLDPARAAPSSSRGPTSDGRRKPDFIAPTGLPSVTAPGFAGTSASAPHAAGAAALLKEALPQAGRTELASALRARALDLGAAGFDGETGAGLLHLGTLTGLGLLLPEGADGASLAGDLPEGTGLAALLYQGPDGYPARFVHLLTPPGRAPATIFRPDGEGSYDRYIPGAPPPVQTMELLNDGDPLIVRFR